MRPSWRFRKRARRHHRCWSRTTAPRPDGARDAVQAAINEGAELILGPLFAAMCARRPKSPRRRQAGDRLFHRHVRDDSRASICFRSWWKITSTAIIDFAASRGKKSIAVMAPENDYANVAFGALQQAAARRDMRVARSNATSLAGRRRPRNIAALGGQVDALFIPEQAGAMPDVARALTANGIDSRKMQILGTGLWNDSRVLSLPALAGGLVRFAGKRRFRRLRTALSRQIRRRSHPRGDAGLRFRFAFGGFGAHAGRPRFSEEVLTNPRASTALTGCSVSSPMAATNAPCRSLQINNGTTTVVEPGAAQPLWRLIAINGRSTRRFA